MDTSIAKTKPKRLSSKTPSRKQAGHVKGSAAKKTKPRAVFIKTISMPTPVASSRAVAKTTKEKELSEFEQLVKKLETNPGNFKQFQIDATVLANIFFEKFVSFQEKFFNENVLDTKALEQILELVQHRNFDLMTDSTRKLRVAPMEVYAFRPIELLKFMFSTESLDPYPIVDEFGYRKLRKLGSTKICNPQYQAEAINFAIKLAERLEPKIRLLKPEQIEELRDWYLSPEELPLKILESFYKASRI